MIRPSQGYDDRQRLGSGVPISQTRMDAGCAVHGVDASPSMVPAFRARFPGVPIECDSVEASRFFDRTLDGVVAWGLMSLLDADGQRLLISKVRPGSAAGWPIPVHVTAAGM